MTLAEHVFAAFDDLAPIGRRLEDADAMTLFTHLRDEMFFLPSFLDHYRRLGIERFVVVDDRSEDGSREFLLDQPDVMVMGTRWRYGDKRPLAPGHLRAKTERAKSAWQNILPARYARDRWAVKVDLDEFIDLPPGMSFRDLAERAGRAGGGAVYGAMLDLYPERLAPEGSVETFDPDSAWYFDALPHLRPRGGRVPRQVYHGSRARLLEEHGIWPHPAIRGLRRALGLSRPPMLIYLFKAVFVRWEMNTLQKNSHIVNVPAVPGTILPIRHYKFADDLHRRVRVAVAERQYVASSRFYDMLDRLLEQIAAKDAPLTFEQSRPATGYAAFAASGNAIIPD